MLVFKMLKYIYQLQMTCHRRHLTHPWMQKLAQKYFLNRLFLHFDFFFLILKQMLDGTEIVSGLSITNRIMLCESDS